MKTFIYYEINDVHDSQQNDVAAVKAETLKDAIKILKKYYCNVSKQNVFELTFKDYENQETNIMIISEY